MNKRICVLLIGILLFSSLLTGCWDQRLLRDRSLILSIGYDRGEKKELVKTITSPDQTSEGTSGNDDISSIKSNVVSLSGNTAKDIDKHMDQVIPEKFDHSKARVLLFGEEIAKEGIFSTLDSMYRDLRGPLNAQVAIFAGEASEALSIHSEQPLLKSEIFTQLLVSAEEAGITKNESVQTACPILLADGKDLVLPYLSYDEEKGEERMEGIALFHKDKMTGTLGSKETSMFLVLADQITKNISFNMSNDEDNEDPNKNFVNIEIHHNKRKLDVQVSGKDIRATIDVNLRVSIDEYASDQLEKKQVKKKLEKIIAKKLHTLSEQTVTKMQEANNDSLGIGEKLRAFHPETFEKIDWIEEYPNIPIDTSFEVDIIEHGIMN